MTGTSQLFQIVAVVLHLNTGVVEVYGPGNCRGLSLCGPYQWYSECENNAAYGRHMVPYYVGSGVKVTITCEPYQPNKDKH